MGTANSTPSQTQDDATDNPSVSVVEIINLMMPVYYTTQDVTESELELVKSSWQLVLDNKCPAFFELKESMGTLFTCASSIEFFCENFYHRLFDVSPLSRALFKDEIKVQGEKLTKLMSIALDQYGNKTVFETSLVKLAEFHNTKGVQAVEYGIVGDVLFWALKTTIGRDFTPDHRTAWVKVYCCMLRVIIPVAVAYQAMDADKRAKALAARAAQFEEYSRSHYGDVPIDKKADGKESKEDSNEVGGQSMKL